MCTERSPSPITLRPCPGGTATFAQRCLLSDKRGRRERKRRLGGERGRVICGQRQKASVGGRGVTFAPSCHRRRAKEVAQCKRLTRAQTTWHFAVGAAIPTPQRSVNPTRGEGEGNLARTRRHAHQSVSVKILHRFTLHLQSTWNQHIAKQKW